MERIKSIDGFRTIAVLGVLWAHVWMFYGNPGFSISGVNVAQIISFFGTGVDLFFVISGFCMFLMYTVRAQADFNWRYYMQYLTKRWLRIAPAFYVCVIVSGILAVNFSISQFQWTYTVKQLLFIRNFFPDKTLYGPHFWSLCTEWHFYLVLPLIVVLYNKMSFVRASVIAVTICCIIRGILASITNDPFNLVNYSIFNRLIEFVLGIIIAKLFIDEKKGLLISSKIGLFIGLAVAVFGRLLMLRCFKEHSGIIGWFARSFDLQFLAGGMALVIINVLNTETLFKRFLESWFMTYVGKVSYSMYLWHWLIAGVVVHFFLSKVVINGFLGVNVAFVVSLLILIPISLISYYLFESIYFKFRNKVIR